uniref:Uncharacterized protein n=1 Tax=Nelumbo nucifera TaxID=4432 RepID=A0A822ZDZ6_NELNU|nr:TPA_asm: hypothetical protein HUJ06_014141 [Nelumbo nucifera]
MESPQVRIKKENGNPEKKKDKSLGFPGMGRAGSSNCDVSRSSVYHRQTDNLLTSDVSFHRPPAGYRRVSH